MLKIKTNNTTGFPAYIDETTGAAFLTATKFIEISGMDNKTLDRILLNCSVANYVEKYPEVLTDEGVRSLAILIDSNDIPTILTEWNPRSDAKKIAKKTITNKLLIAGATAFVYHLCGYQMKQKEDSPKALPTRDARENAETAQIIEAVNNETLKQLLRDQLIDELSVKVVNKQLPQAREEYTIVKQRAKELGYTIKEIGNGSSLGKYIKKHLSPSFVERTGKYPVNHYLVCDELDTHIKTYMGMKRCIA